MRSGTENVPGIAAFAKAAEIGYKNRESSIKPMEQLRTRLIAIIESEMPEISITLPKYHAPHILNVTLPGIKSETMLHYLSSEGIFVSSGSACSSNGGHVSSALTAYGRTPEEADTSIRISLSPFNDDAELSALVRALERGLEKLARIKR